MVFGVGRETSSVRQTEILQTAKVDTDSDMEEVKEVNKDQGEIVNIPKQFLDWYREMGGGGEQGRTSVAFNERSQGGGGGG